MKSLYRELAREGDLSAIVFHRFWSPLHEITPPQRRLPPRFSPLRRRVSPSLLDIFLMP
jgi:hypothetical protein